MGLRARSPVTPLITLPIPRAVSIKNRLVPSERMAIAPETGLVAIREAPKAPWTAKLSSFTGLGGEEKSLVAGHRGG